MFFFSFLRKKSKNKHTYSITQKIQMHMRRAFLPQLIPSQRIIVEETKQPKMKKVNQYLLRSKLGCGSSAKVYLAKDETTGKYYAAKAVQILERRHNGLGAAGLEREIRIMRQLNHPNIIHLHDVLYASSVDTAYLFIEWADCGTLMDAINGHHKFNEATLASIFHQITLGLSYLHSQGIVHKDIKPSNILLFSYGAAKLSDFGIGHSFQSAEAVVGTPAYQAPEMFEDDEEDVGNGDCEYSEEEIDPAKGDIWSLGVSLYEAAFGRLPYYGNNLYEIVRSIYNTKLEIPENDYSPLLNDLIKKMLTVNQSERPSLAEVMKHEFFNAAANSPNLHLPSLAPTGPIPDVKIVKVPAVVCPENFSFASELRSFSCPGAFPSVIPDIDSPMIEKASSLDNCEHL